MPRITILTHFRTQILTNFLFLAACSILLGLQKLLYGPLRPIEVEQLYEKAWFAVTETCLALTIFRGELGGWFVVMFFSLLSAKVWGWIGEGRVEVLEQQPPQNPRLFHTRLAISLSLSVLFDSWMLEYLVKEVLRQAKPDMTVMFGFEFAVLTILSSSTLVRYGISLVEMYIVRRQKEKRIQEIRKERASARQREQEGQESGQASDEQEPTTENRTLTTPAPAVDDPIDDSELEVEGWEGKGRWVFYLDLTTGINPLDTSTGGDSVGANSHRLSQTRCLSLILFYSTCFLWPPNSHSARRFPYLPVFLQANCRFHKIPNSDEGHEPAVP